MAISWMKHAANNDDYKLPMARWHGSNEHDPMGVNAPWNGVSDIHKNNEPTHENKKRAGAAFGSSHRRV